MARNGEYAPLGISFINLDRTRRGLAIGLLGIGTAKHLTNMGIAHGIHYVQIQVSGKTSCILINSEEANINIVEMEVESLLRFLHRAQWH